MAPQDFLFYSLGIGFLILVGFLSYAAYNLSNSLKELTSILTKIDELAQDAEDLKNYIKNGIQFLINMFTTKKPLARKASGLEGGEKNGKK